MPDKKITSLIERAKSVLEKTSIKKILFSNKRSLAEKVRYYLNTRDYGEIGIIERNGFYYLYEKGNEKNLFDKKTEDAG